MASSVERFRKVLVHGQLLMVKGVIDREKEVIHVRSAMQ